MRIWRFLIVLIFFVGCSETHTPKPRGFFRIDFPDKNYSRLGGDYPYDFDVPDYARIENDRDDPNEKYWINVAVPQNKVEIHLSYYDLQSNKAKTRELLVKLMEETRSLAYKHSIKATSIDEQVFINKPKNVFGTIYKISGNAASPMQFFLTDSTKHFLRGAFYIREVPDIDSLRPVIDFIEPDVIRMIESTTWK